MFSNDLADKLAVSVVRKRGRYEIPEFAFTKHRNGAAM